MTISLGKTKTASSMLPSSAAKALNGSSFNLVHAKTSIKVAKGMPKNQRQLLLRNKRKLDVANILDTMTARSFHALDEEKAEEQSTELSPFTTAGDIAEDAGLNSGLVQLRPTSKPFTV